MLNYVSSEQEGALSPSGLGDADILESLPNRGGKRFWLGDIHLTNGDSLLPYVGGVPSMVASNHAGDNVQAYVFERHAIGPMPGVVQKDIGPNHTTVRSIDHNGQILVLDKLRQHLSHDRSCVDRGTFPTSSARLSPRVLAVDPREGFRHITAH